MTSTEAESSSITSSDSAPQESTGSPSSSIKSSTGQRETSAQKNVRHEQAIQQLQALLLETQRNLNNLMALQQPSATKKEDTASPKKTTKPRLPKPFEGKTKDRADLWLDKIERYHQLSATPTDEWVAYTATYLSGSAETWFGDAITKRKGMITWAQFKVAFMERFANLEIEENARIELRKIRQTTTLNDYIDRFYRLMASIPEMNDKDQALSFICGLKDDEVRKQVRRRHAVDLRVAVDIARQEEALCSSQATLATTKPTSTYARNDRAPRVHAVTSEGQPQRKKKKNDGKDRRPKEVADQCFKEGRCLKCLEVGHRRNECKNAYATDFPTN
jgi:Retrotransposon gag protein